MKSPKNPSVTVHHPRQPGKSTLMKTLALRHKREETIRIFFEEDIRCEKFYPLFMCISDELPSGLKDTLESELKPCSLLGLEDDFIEPLINQWSFSQEVAEKLRVNNKIGFLAEFATPIPHKFSKDGRSWSGSWGFYRTEWFYADDLVDLQKQVISWVKEHFEKCKLKDMASET